MGCTVEKNIRCFDSFGEYEAWSDKFEEYYETETHPVYIDDGWKVCMDMFIDCKSWKTAVKRFAKTFYPLFAQNGGDDGWFILMYDECMEGRFEDKTGWRTTFSYNEEENEKENYKSAQTFGSYGWGVEQIDENRWYIFLNISGAYANKPERAVAA